MKFWDSSALVPLILIENSSAIMHDLFVRDGDIAVWWGTEVEFASAIARLERMGEIERTTAMSGYVFLKALKQMWNVIDPGEVVRSTAARFLRVHDLRAADALQLSAAFIAAEGRPESLTFVSLDHRLAAAAQREGFEVIDRSALGLT